MLLALQQKMSKTCNIGKYVREDNKAVVKEHKQTEQDF